MCSFYSLSSIGEEVELLSFERMNYHLENVYVCWTRRVGSASVMLTTAYYYKAIIARVHYVHFVQMLPTSVNTRH